MRQLTTDAGSVFDVTVSKASWGTLSLLFVPRGPGAPRSIILAEETQFDAERALMEMSDAELMVALQAATP